MTSLSKKLKVSKKPLKRSNFTRPTIAFKHKQVLDNLAENGGSMRKAIEATGLYSQEVADNPSKITTSKSWQELMEYYMSDDDLAKKHKELLNSTRMDHMVFPLGPKDEDDSNLSGSKVLNETSGEEGNFPEEIKERTTLTDKEIIEMLAEVNCTVRRIVHGESARHVYFWAADNMARDKALDKAYKLKGRYSDETVKPPGGNSTYNFIFSGEVQEEIKKIDGRIKAMLIQPKNEPDPI